VADWREEALAEIGALKPYYVTKHGWQPDVAESEEAVDLYVRLRGRRFPDKEFLLRLPTCPTGGRPADARPSLIPTIASTPIRSSGRQRRLRSTRTTSTTAS
jgi:hypothetical protein